MDCFASLAMTAVGGVPPPRLLIISDLHQGKFPSQVDVRGCSARPFGETRLRAISQRIFSSQRIMVMSRVIAAVFATALAVVTLPTAASAGCHSCYAPPQPCCGPQYQMQVAPAQYRTVQETVMV